MLTLLSCLLLVIGLAPAAAAQSVVMEGGGFGHGVGMSQYGARSMATKGFTAPQILGHYYHDTTLASREAPTPYLTVGLTTSDFVRMVVVEGPVPVVAGGKGTRTARAGDEIRVAHISGTTCDVRVGGGDVDRVRCDGIRVALERVTSATPDVRVRLPRSGGDGHDLQLARGVMRFGQPSDRSQHGNLHASLVIRMQAYLYGLGEMPSSWPMEALKAQAIAGRTYAHRFHAAAPKDSCSCHIGTTTATQHYVGWSKEGEGNYGVRWRRAVDATGDPDGNTGRILLHGGQPITSWYFSSSFGRTEDAGDLWANSVPWIRSVDDPYSIDADAENSRARWTAGAGQDFAHQMTYDNLGSWLGMSVMTSIRVAERNRSGSAAALEVTGRAGTCSNATRTVETTQLRTRFGLPSHAILSAAVRDAPPSTCDWLVGDFTGDGRDDIAGYDSSTGRWFVGVSDGDGYAISRWNEFPRRADWDTHEVVDVDGDGTDEILSFNQTSRRWTVQRSRGSSFSHEVWTEFSTGSGWDEHRVVRTSGGREALASFHRGSGNWVVSREANGQVSSFVWAHFATTTGWETRVGDVDGDGLDDLVNFHPSSGKYIVLRYGERRKHETWLTRVTRTGWEEHVLADLTGDGRADIASYHPGSGNWMVGVSTGSRFDNTRWTSTKTTSGWQTHLAGHVTGGPRAQLLSYHAGTGNWVVHRVTGGRVVSEVWTSLPTQRGWRQHQVVDVDGDDREDIASFHGVNTWWANRSTGTSFSTNRWADLR